MILHNFIFKPEGKEICMCNNLTCRRDGNNYYIYLQGLKQEPDEKYKSIITKQNFLQIIYEGKFLSFFYNQLTNTN